MMSPYISYAGIIKASPPVMSSCCVFLCGRDRSVVHERHRPIVAFSGVVEACHTSFVLLNVQELVSGCQSTDLSEWVKCKKLSSCIIRFLLSLPDEELQRERERERQVKTQPWFTVAAPPCEDFLSLVEDLWRETRVEPQVLRSTVTRCRILRY